LTEAGVIEKSFEQSEAYFCEECLSARKGQIPEASIVPVPKQRKTWDENRGMKERKVPED
jgi:hypothetical protein